MSSLRRVFAMADAVISAAIKARAAAIRQPRVFIGFFEWLALGILTKSEVHMIFGEHVVKLNDVFAPSLVLEPSHIVRVAAVKWDGKVCKSAGKIDEALPAINHFVIGLEASSHSEPSPSLSRSTAQLAAGRAGWVLRATDCTGDCGIDAMAFLSKRPRFPSVWKKIREELAAYMDEVSGIPVWQDAYRSCQEDAVAAPPDHSASCGGMGPPPTLAAKGQRLGGLTEMPARGSSASSSSGSGASGSTAASSLCVPGLGGKLDAIAALPVVGSALARNASSGGPLDGAAPATTSDSSLAGSAVAAVAPISSCPPCAELESAASAASPPEPKLAVAAALVFAEPAALAPPPPLPPPPLPPVIVVAGPQAFRAWLTSLSTSDMEVTSRSYAAFRDAEALWQKEHKDHAVSAAECPPRRRHVASKVGFRLATGLAYLKWRREVGATSASPLKAERRTRTYLGGPQPRPPYRFTPSHGPGIFAPRFQGPSHTGGVEDGCSQPVFRSGRWRSHGPRRYLDSPPRVRTYVATRISCSPSGSMLI